MSPWGSIGSIYLTAVGLVRLFNLRGLGLKQKENHDTVHIRMVFILDHLSHFRVYFLPVKLTHNRSKAGGYAGDSPL
jgi:hypothetical protein